MPWHSANLVISSEGCLSFIFVKHEYLLFSQTNRIGSPCKEAKFADS